jgi:hypothetical protein
VRLEDPIIVTETGAENVTAGVPAEIEPLYALIRQRGVDSAPLGAVMTRGRAAAAARRRGSSRSRTALAAAPGTGYCGGNFVLPPVGCSAPRNGCAGSTHTCAEVHLGGMREARLRPEFADLYPGLTAGQWLPAARIAEAVLANVLLQQMGEGPAPDRLLPEAHFDFRGGTDAERAIRSERASDQS